MKVTEPVIMGRPVTWLSLMLKNRGPELPFIKRAGAIMAASTLAVPFRLYERLVYLKSVQAVGIEKPPVFIIGFWRSGTTFLHNLLCVNPELGYLSLLQTLAPEFFLSSEGLLRRLFSNKIPPTRPMDNMALSMDSPQEDELALFNMSAHSLYYQMFFPKNAGKFFDKYVLMDTLSSKEKLAWKRTYMLLIKKLTHYSRGRRLVLKNPANTGRIKELLDLFPGAKFVHIVRDPYMVYMSCLHMFEKLLPFCQLQNINREEVREHVLCIYMHIMSRFLEDKHLIPKSNLVEIRYEQLEKNPPDVMKRIYQSLGLENYEGSLPLMKEHLDSQKSYKKNQFILTDEIVNTINSRWRCIIEKLGYQIIHPNSAKIPAAPHAKQACRSRTYVRRSRRVTSMVDN